ncbi:MAG: sulfite exporter TauE/SafE family protein [Pseudorhodoplanes sp.]
MFDAQIFTSVTSDPRFLLAVAVTILSGVVRGFSGFGSALIYIPLMAAIYEPRVAAVTLLLTDFVASAPFTIPQTRRCNWREVAPLSLAAAATIPLGVLALQYADPTVLRWGAAFIVTMLLVVLISGWRYHVVPSISHSLGVGLLAGIGSGALQIAGPFAIIYWLGGPASAAVIRANLMVYLTSTQLVSLPLYYFRGLFTADVLILSVLLGPIFIASMAVGTWLFRGAAEDTYRRVAYLIVAVSALVSLPLFDELLR